MNETKDRLEDISELLGATVPEVFATMMGIEASQIPAETLQESGNPAVVASVGFIGDVTGVVYLEVADSFARRLAGAMLGMADQEFDGNGMIDDAIGELSNMVVGAVKSRLCDDGAPCVLTIPTIVRGTDLRVRAGGSVERRLLGFLCGEDEVVLELLVGIAR